MPTRPEHEVVRLHAGTTPDVEPLRREVVETLRDLLDGPPSVELTSSCTHGLELAATVLGIGPGDEVVVPAYSFPSTANAFLLRGATIRFADVDPATGNVDPSDVERCTGPRTAAIVCMHYGGVACDVDALGALADRHGAHLVEDAAQGMFGSYRGTPLGRFGTMAAFSFHRTKNVAAGDGGALVVNDAALVDQARMALEKGTNRAQFESGAVRSYEWCTPGSAWHLPDPQVAILAESLRRRDQVQEIRQRVWRAYDAGLRQWAESVGVTLPVVPDGAVHPAHLYWVGLPGERARDRFVEWCGTRGVQVARHYGSLPASAYGRRVAHPDDRCPQAARFAAGLARLPLHHQLTDADLDRVLSVVTAFDPTRAD